MEANIENINFKAGEEEKAPHDVIAHIHTFAKQCPKAAPIIHLGIIHLDGQASCFVSANTDLIVLRDALDLLSLRVANVVKALSTFALTYKDLPTLKLSHQLKHLHPAQLTTVGKRCCLWLSDLLMDERNLSDCRRYLRFKGVRSSSELEAALLGLFDGNLGKVKALDLKVTQLAGFEKPYAVTGEMISRKVGLDIISAIAGFGATALNICRDVTLLKELGEFPPIDTEPLFATASKLAALHVPTTLLQAPDWGVENFPNRLLNLPASFLCADDCLLILLNISQGLVVDPEAIERHIDDELPFLAAENFIMAMVKAGGDRQVCHDKILVLSQEAGAHAKQHGKKNYLVERINADPYFAPILNQLVHILDAKTFTGCASTSKQVEDFVKEEVDPILAKYAGKL